MLRLLTSSEVSWLLLQMSVVNPVQPETLSEVNRMITYLNANVNLQLLAENLLLKYPNL